MRLNHVALTVEDRQRSAGFYAEHFGLTERVHEDSHLLLLRSRWDTVLALSDGAPPVLPRTNHFGFQLDTAEEVHQARERFRARSVAEVEWQDAGGITRVQVRDPDGYLVDVFAIEQPGPPRSDTP